MKIKIFFLYIIFFCFLKEVYAKEYILEASAISKLITIEVSNNFRFSSYTSEGMWDDSSGDYGHEKCAGYVKQINKKVELEVICKNINQNEEIFWNSRVRKSGKGVGIGELTILNGTGKYKKMIGLKYPYGINYKEKYAWLKAKCKMEN